MPIQILALRRLSCRGLRQLRGSCRRYRVRFHMHPRQLRELYLSFGVGGIRHMAPLLTEWPEGTPNHGKSAQLGFMELEVIHVRCARLIMKTSSTAAAGCCLRSAGLYPHAHPSW